jgi:hypothetical protein
MFADCDESSGSSRQSLEVDFESATGHDDDRDGRMRE